MILRSARVQNYKSIDDSGWVELADVTCLVGKNESGKTAWLQALGKLSPVRGQPVDFDYELEYPRKRLQDYKRIHDSDPATVISAKFELEARELEVLERHFGSGCLATPEVTVTKDYANITHWTLPYQEKKVVAHLVANAGLPEANAKELGELGATAELREALEKLGDDPPQASELLALMDGWRRGRLGNAMVDALEPFLPRFFYFDDYSIMHGRIAIAALRQRRDAGDLDEADRTFLALLDLVGEELEEFETLENQERLIASLEAASNSISDELFEFWSQNRNLEVEFRLLGPDPASSDPDLKASNNLMVRIRNQRHRVSVIFDERSRGFVWFFSFLAYFSQLQRTGAKDRDLVLLLDEPGLSLHAKAQGDFLRFINERLAPEYQVIYTTHSPFMVEPTRLDRVRTVEDTDEHGTRVSSDVLGTTQDTIFPLQAALGYELAQTLFVGKHNLIVEGPSDYLYLTVLSGLLKSKKRVGLDEHWTIVPVGGIDKIPTFIALLGAELEVAVMVDGKSGGSRKINDLINRQVIDQNRVIALANVLGANEADIEDFFDVGFYCKLVKDSGAAPAAKSKLKAGDRVIKRIEEQAGKYDHYEPARYLLEKQADLVKDIDDDTLNRFEELFKQLNALLD